MKTEFTEDELRQNALDTYKVMSITYGLDECISRTFDNLEIFNLSPESYYFRYWSRVNSLFVEDLLAHQQQF